MFCFLCVAQVDLFQVSTTFDNFDSFKQAYSALIFVLDEFIFQNPWCLTSTSGFFKSTSLTFNVNTPKIAKIERTCFFLFSNAHHVQYAFFLKSGLYPNPMFINMFISTFFQQPSPSTASSSKMGHCPPSWNKHFPGPPKKSTGLCRHDGFHRRGWESEDGQPQQTCWLFLVWGIPFQYRDSRTLWSIAVSGSLNRWYIGDI